MKHNFAGKAPDDISVSVKVKKSESGAITFHHGKKFSIGG
jgi:hypothetical protein